MRVITGVIGHETNTFSDTPTTLADFQRDSGCGPDFSGGKVLEERFAGTGTIHGGYLAGAAEAEGVETVLHLYGADALRVDDAAVRLGVMHLHRHRD